MPDRLTNLLTFHKKKNYLEQPFVLSGNKSKEMVGGFFSIASTAGWGDLESFPLPHFPHSRWCFGDIRSALRDTFDSERCVEVRCQGVKTRHALDEREFRSMNAQ